jgi:hypothetical protein
MAEPARPGPSTPDRDGAAPNAVARLSQWADDHLRLVQVPRAARGGRGASWELVCGPPLAGRWPQWLTQRITQLPLGCGEGEGVDAGARTRGLAGGGVKETRARPGPGGAGGDSPHLRSEKD